MIGTSIHLGNTFKTSLSGDDAAAFRMKARKARKDVHSQTQIMVGEVGFFPVSACNVNNGLKWGISNESTTLIGLLPNLLFCLSCWLTSDSLQQLISVRNRPGSGSVDWLAKRWRNSLSSEVLHIQLRTKISTEHLQRFCFHDASWWSCNLPPVIQLQRDSKHERLGPLT